MTPQEELEALENTVQDILRGVQDILQAGERLSEEFQGQLAQLLDTATQRIDELQQIIQQGPQVPTPDDLQPSIPSSNINAFAYDKRSGRLIVQFLGKHPNRQGPIYAYGGVPPDIFELFRRGAVPARTNGRNRWGRWWRGKVPSAGASMYTLIKGMQYPYQRIA